MPTLSLSRQWAAAVGICFTLLAAERPATAADLSRIETIVVIYAENRSFDHLYGLFPGANGIANATRSSNASAITTARVLPYLRVWDSQGKPDPRFPELAERTVPHRRAAGRLVGRPGAAQPDPRLLPQHRADQRRPQRHVRGHVHGRRLHHGLLRRQPMKLWQWAKEFTLADNFFMGAFGGSYLNHQYLICACTPVFKDAPPQMRARLDAQRQAREEAGLALRTRRRRADLHGRPGRPDHAGWLLRQHDAAAVSAERHSAGRRRRAGPRGRQGHGAPGLAPAAADRARPSATRCRPRASSWAWYAGGWNAALADGTRPPSEKRSVIYTRENNALNFQPHHQPFNYFARFAPGHAGSRRSI